MEEFSSHPIPEERRERPVQVHTPRLPLIVVLMVLATMGWMIWETLHPTSSLHVTAPSGPNYAIVLTPGRASVAYYLFLVSVAFLPVFYFATALWVAPKSTERPAVVLSSKGQKHPRRLRLLYTTLFYTSLVGAILLCGFSYEALHTELRLTSKVLEYRAGTEQAHIAWEDVRAMKLRLYARSQSMELDGARERILVDLTTFGLPDRAFLVEKLPRIAHLSPLPRRNAEEIVWRRFDIPGEQTE